MSVHFFSASVLRGRALVCQLCARSVPPCVYSLLRRPKVDNPARVHAQALVYRFDTGGVLNLGFGWEVDVKNKPYAKFLAFCFTTALDLTCTLTTPNP